VSAAELRPINQPSLVQEIYDILHQQIVLGQLKPGQRLEVARLAQVLKVSTMPVKQAIARLEVEGYVEVSPRRGTFVAQLELEDLLEALDVRLALDLFVAERMVETLSSEALASMRAAHQRMLDLSADAGEADYYLRQALDRQFHLVPAAALGNRRMLQLREQQHTHAQLARAQGASVRWERADQDHATILAAWERRDVQALRQAIVTHAAHARETLIAHVPRSPEPPMAD
jgi:GntR family transcriptional regulator, rspAB operon transcriptional repressor